jgi:hypothetical protein
MFVQVKTNVNMSKMLSPTEVKRKDYRHLQEPESRPPYKQNAMKEIYKMWYKRKPRTPQRIEDKNRHLKWEDTLGDGPITRS